jgi:hypothetical protein
MGRARRHAADRRGAGARPELSFERGLSRTAAAAKGHELGLLAGTQASVSS